MTEEEEYIPIEKCTSFVMRGLRDIKRQGEPLPEYFDALLPAIMWGTGEEYKITYNGMEMKFVRRKRDGKIMTLGEDGKVYEVL